MAELGVLKYDNLIINDDVITEQITIAASQTILRGDVLVRGNNNQYSRPAGAVAGISLDTTVSEGNVTDVDIVQSDIVRIASENVTTVADETAVSIGYIAGQFNEFAMRFGGASTADDNRDVLAAQSIYMKKSQKQ